MIRSKTIAFNDAAIFVITNLTRNNSDPFTDTYFAYWFLNAKWKTKKRN